MKVYGIEVTDGDYPTIIEYLLHKIFMNKMLAEGFLEGIKRIISKYNGDNAKEICEELEQYDSEIYNWDSNYKFDIVEFDVIDSLDQLKL